MADTGNGTTLSLGTSGFSASIIRIGEIEQEIEALEDSHLGTTTYKTYDVSDLIEGGEFEVEFFYDPDSEPPLGTVEVATYTWPVPSGLSNGATLTASGFIRSRTIPESVNGALMRGKYVFKIDGKATEPTFANAS